jgi:hypothetical protein
VPLTSLVGVWAVAGHDARGAYSGQLELRDAGAGKVDAYRVVHYDGGVKVEGDRELWTAWTGAGTTSGAAAKLQVALSRADFVRSRGGVTRSAADKVALSVTGDITSGPSGVVVHWSAPSNAIADDTLTARAPNGPAPIFATDRARKPVNAPPSGATLATMNSLYASFRTLPTVAPYANDPDFVAGVYYVITDKTDFEFYRAHPKALRVVNKLVDAPSLGETLARAEAYGHSLAEKAAQFDADTPATFVEAKAGQTVDSVVGGVQNATGDGALWTASYLASQAFRYLVTHEPAAAANVAKSADGIQLLMEIVPDRSTFARTIRAATAAPQGGWHTGTGPYTAYEWLEGGNNDMFKGLFYGTLLAYMTLCDPLIPGQDALCARMRSNAKHMVADLALTQGGSSNSNQLIATWLSYYLNGSDLSTALGDWTAQYKVIEAAGLQTKAYATADWSGTHLTFVQMLGMLLLDGKKSLPTANAQTSLRKGIEKMRSDFSVYRMGIWSVLFATKVTTPNQTDIDDARWRLREIPAPRLQLNIDHRVGSSFVMGPFPSLPWKNDWTTNDRTDSLHGYPLFELPLDVYAWRSGPFDYVGNREGVKSPSIDFLHAYWLGRYLALFTASE